MLAVRCRFILFIFFMFVCVGLASCADKLKNQLPKTDDPATNLKAEETQKKKVDKLEATMKPAIDVYKKVLQNEQDFYDVSDGYIYWKEHPLYEDFVANCTEGVGVEYTVLDMDDDGIPEIILNFKGPDLRTVLHYEDGKVYGYSFGYRQMMMIKKDGTFAWKGGSGYRGYGRLQFSGKTYEEIDIAKFEFHSSSSTEKYTFNDIEVSREEFSSFMDSQEVKEDVVWTELTEENVNNLEMNIA